MCQAAAHGERRGPFDVMGAFWAHWEGWAYWERPIAG